MGLKLISKVLIFSTILIYFAFLYITYRWTALWVADFLTELNFPKFIAVAISLVLHFLLYIKLSNICVDYFMLFLDLENNLEDVSIVSLRTGENLKATRKTRADLEPIYLKIDDIKKIIHYSHYIPVGRGFSQKLIDINFPGWAWNQVCSVVMRSKAFKYDNDSSSYKFKVNFEGILIYPTGKFTLDFGDLQCPQKLNYKPIDSTGATE